MDKKYKKFYMMFDKRFKNLILCSNLNCDGRVEQNREFKGLIIWAVILFLRRKSSKTT